ncbi:MAG: NADH-quinone oxidoreductase subunit C [Elusimicrobiales bacterium]|nr:NADH-quinone oxidoreductase subunit C [Elusimicrobiales bacterium]
MKNEILENFKNTFTHSIKKVLFVHEIDVIYIDFKSIKEILSYLKQNGFEFLIDLFAIDYLKYPQRDLSERFEIVYNLYSLQYNKRIIIKVPISENNPEIESVTDIFDAANWYEREVYDMYGIRFIGHPNLKRILMYEEFEGYPLRKDYPFNKKQPRISMKEVESEYKTTN